MKNLKELLDAAKNFDSKNPITLLTVGFLGFCGTVAYICTNGNFNTTEADTGVDTHALEEVPTK